MSQIMRRLCPFVLTVTALGLSGPTAAGEIGFEVIGDEDNGYSVQINYDSKPLATSNGGGEFSMVVENADRSYREVITNWKATAHRFENDALTLTGHIPLGNLVANLDITVVYKKINRFVVKKEIIISQRNARRFFYSLENKLEPVEEPESYWSFDQEKCAGGSLLEYYPAAGFRSAGGVACGLLTDAGHRNLWTRNVRKRSVVGSFDVSGFAAVRTMPDRDLVSVANADERNDGNHYVAFRFGQMFNFNHGPSTAVPMAETDSWEDLEGGSLQFVPATKKKSLRYIITGSADKNSLSGTAIPISVQSGLFYNIHFSYRTTLPTIATRLWEVEETRDVSLYNDRLKATAKEWTEFSQQFYVSDTTAQEHIYRLVISKGYLENAPDYRIEIKDLRVTEHQPVVECYHPLDMAVPSKKTMFIFAEPAKTLRDYRLASQVRLAEGLEFTGTQVEKILFADLNMLSWISDPKDLTPHLVPSLNYSPDMYNRDSFWSALALPDKELNEAIWNKWAATQNNDGGIGTIITPLVG
ncbi:MAG: hypothetical protein QGH40_12920, partial [bacterium]|nr:hypothetical protein [bacterium]